LEETLKLKKIFCFLFQPKETATLIFDKPSKISLAIVYVGGVLLTFSIAFLKNYFKKEIPSEALKRFT